MSPSPGRLEGKRILLVGRSEGHFTYYRSIVEAMIAADATVSLWYVEGWTDGNNAAVAEFRERHPALDLEWVPKRGDRGRGLAFALRELRSYAWYLRRPDASAFYVARWRSYLSGRLGRWACSAAGRRLLTLPLADLVFEALERLLPASPDALRRLRRHAPDAVVVSPSNMRFSEEVEYVKAARRLGLPVAVLVQTWDSLTTKGLLQVVPDVLLAWHDLHRSAAVGLHGVAEDRVRVVGAPFFDKWLPTGDRPAAGAASERPSIRPYILYLGSSANIAKDESWAVLELRRALASHWSPMIRDVEIRVRPHPANRKPFRALGGTGIRVVDTSLPQNAADGRALGDLARGAVAVVGINTSGMIDSVVLDCPTIALRLDEYRQTQALTPHFRAMVDAGAVREEASFAAVADRVLAIWRGEDRDAAGRQAFRRTMVWPRDDRGTAGEAAADAVADLVGRGAARGSGRRAFRRLRAQPA